MAALKEHIFWIALMQNNSLLLWRSSTHSSGADARSVIWMLLYIPSQNPCNTFTKSVQPLQSSCKAVYSPCKKPFKKAFSNRRRNYAEIQWPLQPAPVRTDQSLSMNDSQETSGVLQRWTSLERELFINSQVNQSARELFIHYSPWVCHLCKSSLATD